jgi:ATP-binding cassette subfamily F protein uup
MNSGIADHQRLSELAQQIQVLNNQVDEKSMRWMELTELNEA